MLLDKIYYWLLKWIFVHMVPPGVPTFEAKSSAGAVIGRRVRGVRPYSAAALGLRAAFLVDQNPQPCVSQAPRMRSRG